MWESGKQVSPGRGRGVQWKNTVGTNERKPGESGRVVGLKTTVWRKKHKAELKILWFSLGGGG